MTALNSNRKSAALAFILITILLDMIALGMIAPVLPKLVVTFYGGNTAHAARIYGLFGTVWALMQFVFAPFLGALSDRVGRRLIVLISNFGLGLDYVLMALAPTVGWLFVGRTISGITAASVPAAGAYIADITPPEKRAACFGLVGAAFGIGFIVGPALGGLLGAISPRLPFWVAAALSLANAMYGLFVLPESLKAEHRQNFQWRRANPVGALKLLKSHSELLGLAAASFFNALAHEVLPSTFVLYGSYRYNWNERSVGLALAAVGVCYGVVQGVLVRPAVEKLGERGAFLAGLFFGIIGFALLGFATTGLIFCAAIPIMSLWGIAGPAAQGLMTRRVGPGEQGQLQGATGSLRGIAGLIGPGLFTLTFARFIKPEGPVHFPGAAFLLASILVMISAFAAWRATRAKGASTLLPEQQPGQPTSWC